MTTSFLTDCLTLWYLMFHWYKHVHFPKSVISFFLYAFDFCIFFLTCCFWSECAWIHICSNACTWNTWSLTLFPFYFFYLHTHIYLLPVLYFICVPRHTFIYTSACEKIVIFKPSWTLFIVHALKPRKIPTNYLRFGFWGCFICGFADELRRQESYIGLCCKLCIFFNYWSWH